MLMDLLSRTFSKRPSLFAGVAILFTFLALIAGASGAGSPGEIALRSMAEAIGIGVAVGVGLALIAAWALRFAAQREWIEDPWTRISIPALAFACFGLTQFLGGSGFIACFTGGILFGALTKEHKKVGTAAQVSHGSSIVSDTMTGINIIVCSVLFVRILWNFFQRIESTPAVGSSACVSVSKARIAPQR